MFNRLKRFFLSESYESNQDLASNIINLKEKKTEIEERNFLNSIMGLSLKEVLSVINKTNNLTEETKIKALELGKNSTLDKIINDTKDEVVSTTLKLVEKPNNDRKKVLKQPIDTATPDMFDEYAA